MPTGPRLRAASRRDVPEHLREYQRRLEAAGIDARPPTAGADHELPEPMKLDGQPLSEIVVRMRRDD